MFGHLGKNRGTVEPSIQDAFAAAQNTPDPEPVPVETESEDEDWGADYEGQLAVDVFETPDDLVIKAPIAGVDPSHLDIQINENQLTVSGERQDSHQLDADNVFFQECYWGSFSRTIQLPIAVDTKKAKASIKHGLLTIRLPKDERARAKRIEVELE